MLPLLTVKRLCKKDSLRYKCIYGVVYLCLIQCIQVKFPDRFQLPLDPRWEVKGLIQDKCRFMDSKKLPLWLTFENVEPNAQPINVIFKVCLLFFGIANWELTLHQVGDDIRQDILTLQMIRIMDKMWKNASMDLLLQPYHTS